MQQLKSCNEPIQFLKMQVFAKKGNHLGNLWTKFQL